MKKRFIAMAVAVMTLGGVMSAQTPETATDNTTTTTCTHDKQCGKKDRKDRKQDGRRNRHQPGKANMFEGIELTAEQQQAIAALQQENRANREQARQQAQADREQARQQAQAAREAKRQAFNDSLKAILTPEQYAQYEQNVAAAKAQRENVDKQRGGDKQRGETMKGRHNMRRGDRAGKRPAPTATQTTATQSAE